MATTQTISFDILKDAARQGLNRVAEGTGQTMDRDLMMYEKLQPDDFDVLIEQHGVEATLSYIRAMEVRRSRQNG